MSVQQYTPEDVTLLTKHRTVKMERLIDLAFLHPPEGRRYLCRKENIQKKINVNAVVFNGMCIYVCNEIIYI